MWWAGAEGERREGQRLCDERVGSRGGGGLRLPAPPLGRRPPGAALQPRHQCGPRTTHPTCAAVASSPIAATAAATAASLMQSVVQSCSTRFHMQLRSLHPPHPWIAVSLCRSAASDTLCWTLALLRASGPLCSSACLRLVSCHVLKGTCTTLHELPVCPQCPDSAPTRCCCCLLLIGGCGCPLPFPGR